jgi:hypothetical protein
MEYVYHLSLKRQQTYGEFKGLYANWSIMDIYRNPPTANDVVKNLMQMRAQYAPHVLMYKNIDDFILKIVEFGIPVVNDDRLEFFSYWNDNKGNYLDNKGYARILRYEMREN